MIENNENILSTLLRDINRKEWQGVNHQLHETAGITAQQAMVLKMIGEKPGLIQKDIANAMQRKAATISTFLKNLEQIELIERKIPITNTRNKEICLTSKGEEVVRKYNVLIDNAGKQLTAALSIDQQQQLIDLLQIINNEMN